jgi:SpoIID/LytB domain protein
VANYEPRSPDRSTATMTALTHTRQRLIAVLLVALAVSALALVVAADGEGAVKFRIRGKGYGHGVGMSQWGAFGFAKKGTGYRKILRHYYSGTKIGRAKSDRVSVLLAVRSGSIAFSNARRACGRRVKPGKTYRAELGSGGRKVRLSRRDGKRLGNCGTKLAAKPAGKIEIAGEGSYRGKLVARAASGGLNVINRVPLDGYLRGVVPNEVPAGWPGDALRAQAVAARSYALATGVDGEGFQLYDDTRSQVYGGVANEQRPTSRAVAKTTGEVVRYRGEVIPAFFFSTSGGRTENVEYGFSGGSPRPYLRSVRDPFDGASPYHSWKLKYSRRKMESMLGSLVEGRLRAIRVLKTGASPRIVRARVIGTRGKAAVSGDELRSRLGLRSTWASFKRVRK